MTVEDLDMKLGVDTASEAVAWDLVWLTCDGWLALPLMAGGLGRSAASLLSSRCRGKCEV